MFTPVFDRVELMKECMDSVLSQSFDDFEYVVGDNASTDGTYELLMDAARVDERLRVIRHSSNIGMQANADALYGAVVGEFVIMVSSDDLLLPGALSRFVDALDAHPEASMATSSTAVFGADGLPFVRQDLGFNLAVVSEDHVFDGHEMARLILLELRNLIGNPPLYRRSMVSQATWERIGRQTTMAGDVAVYLELLAQGSVVYLPEPLRAYRLHPGQFTQQSATAVREVQAHAWLLDRAAALGVIDAAFEREALLGLVERAAPRLAALARSGGDVDTLAVAVGTLSGAWARLAELFATA